MVVLSQTKRRCLCVAITLLTLACQEAFQRKDSPDGSGSSSSEEKESDSVASSIIIEVSESYPSPTGACRVSATSTTFADGTGQSQVMVSYESGGNGLVALGDRRVSFGFKWDGDNKLTVKYPKELPPPSIDFLNTSFNCRPGARGVVKYEAVPTASIRPHRWTQHAQIRLLKEQELARGTIVTTEVNGALEHSYSYSDASVSDSSVDVLMKRGYQGGGDSWAAIIAGLVSIKAPEVSSALAFDPESDSVTVRSRNRESLLRVAELVEQAKRDPKLLNAAVAWAEAQGQME